MNILIIGSGGREHTLAWRLTQEGHRVFCVPGNAGTQSICHPIAPLPASNNILGIVEAASDLQIDLTVVDATIAEVP